MRTTGMETLISSTDRFLRRIRRNKLRRDLDALTKLNRALGEQRALELTRRARDKSAGQDDFQLRLVDGSDYPHPGRLDFIDAAIDPKNDTLQMRIVVPNPEGMLRPGQYVRVLVPSAARPSAILIPQKAVQELQGLKTVYVVGADNKVSVRQIKATYRLGNDWVLDDGLQAGEVLVVDGLQKVTPGAIVKPVFAAGHDAGDSPHS